MGRPKKPAIRLTRRLAATLPPATAAVVAAYRHCGSVMLMHRTDTARAEETLRREARHFADCRRYPVLGPAELEYRAKLVQLILAENTQRALLEDFAAQAQPDRASPHAFASLWLMTRLRERLATADLPALPRSQVREAAQARLHQHTQSLLDGGAARVETALP